MIEKRLDEAAYTKDKQHQQRLIEDLAQLSDDRSLVAEIAQAVLDPDEAIGMMALRVLEEMGYPRNAGALPQIVQGVASGHLSDPTSRGRQALHVLIRLGTAILPELTSLAQTDEVIEEIVYDALVQVGSLWWQSVEQVNTQLGEALVHDLAYHPDDVLDFLIFVLRRPLKEWWELAVKVIIAIGYPRNSKALPQLLWTASDPNVPGAREALDYLGSLAISVIVPHLVAALLAPEGESAYPGWKSTCAMLQHLDRQYIAPCGPAIAYRLSVPDAFMSSPVHVLLHLLEMIGPQCAVYALPTLLVLIEREGASPLSVRAWHLIETFDPKERVPYGRLIASLRGEE